MHVYKSLVDGRPLPSVTYIIDKTKPLAEIIKFAKIKAKKIEEEGETEEGWNQRCIDGRNRGTLIHAFAEHYLVYASKKAQAIKDGCCFNDYVDKELDNILNFWTNKTELGIGDYIKQLHKFFDDLTLQTNGDWEVLGNEEEVQLNLDNKDNPSGEQSFIGYGGRADLRLRIGNNYSLIDFKTTKPYKNWDGIEVHQWSDWALWRKPKQIPVYQDKVLSNGDIKQVRLRDKNGRYVFEKEVRPDKPDWSWVGSYPYNYYLEQCLYILAYRDMQSKGFIDNNLKINSSSLLVIFPKNYQLVQLPTSVWEGCKLEAMERVSLFYKEHYQKWLLEVTFDMPDGQPIRDKDREPKGLLPKQVVIPTEAIDDDMDSLPF